MSEVPPDKLKKALRLLGEAERILFDEIRHSHRISEEIVEGLDKLDHAFIFARNPWGKIPLCPACDCRFFEKVGRERFRCLSCDAQWSREQIGKELRDGSKKPVQGAEPDDSGL